MNAFPQFTIVFLSEARFEYVPIVTTQKNAQIRLHCRFTVGCLWMPG